MSSFKGKSVKNKSQTRKEIKVIKQLNEQLLKDKDNPLLELLELQKEK